MVTTKKNMFVLLAFVLLIVSSCQQRPYPIKLKHAENYLMTNYDSAYNLLSGMQQEIKSESQATQMYYQILLCRAQDLCYVVHKSDIEMKKVIEFYKQCHDNEHLFQAYYCMGCIYRDFKDAPRALSYYQDALNLKKYSKDDALTARLYNQIGQLQESGYSFKSAQTSYIMALKYFKRSNDSLTIPHAILDVAHTFMDQNNMNEALSYCLQAKVLTDKLHNEDQKAGIRLEITNVFFQLDKYPQAEEELNLIGNRLKRNRDLSAYNLGIGLLLDSRGKNDAAAKCYKLSASLGDSNLKEEAYDYLYQGYKAKSDYKTALTYLELCREMMTINRENDHDKEIAQMQSLYNYQRTESKNQKLTTENEHHKLAITVLLSLLIIIGIGIIVYRQRDIISRQRRDKIIEELSKQQKKTEAYLREKEKNIAELKIRLDKKSEEKIAAMQQSKILLQADIKGNEETWIKFKQSSIFFIFHKAVKNNNLIYANEQMIDFWTTLQETIDLYFNDFTQKLYAICPNINEKEYKVCLMIKTELSFSDMSVLLFTSPQNITNIRKRLQKKFYYHNSNGKSFDDFVHDL
jgi:tetratricopeptide (TPR) repeat protein